MKHKHKHHDLIVQWAADTSLEVEYFNTACNDWRRTVAPSWYDDTEYRIADPYRELKGAYERGEVIQVRVGVGNWDDVERPRWLEPASFYRIKPRAKKVKLLAFIDAQGWLRWIKEDLWHPTGLVRVPSEDKEVEL